MLKSKDQNQSVNSLLLQKKSNPFVFCLLRTQASFSCVATNHPVICRDRDFFNQLNAPLESILQAYSDSNFKRIQLTKRNIPLSKNKKKRLLLLIDRSCVTKAHKNFIHTPCSILKGLLGKKRKSVRGKPLLKVLESLLPPLGTPYSKEGKPLDSGFFQRSNLFLGKRSSQKLRKIQAILKKGEKNYDFPERKYAFFQKLRLFFSYPFSARTLRFFLVFPPVFYITSSPFSCFRFFPVVAKQEATTYPLLATQGLLLRKKKQEATTKGGGVEKAQAVSQSRLGNQGGFLFFKKNVVLGNRAYQTPKERLRQEKNDLFAPKSKPIPLAQTILKTWDTSLPLGKTKEGFSLEGRKEKEKEPVESEPEEENNTKKSRFFKERNAYLIPDFVEIQRKSFFQLLENGLIEEFSKRNPITNKNLEIFFYPEYYQLTPPEHNPRRAILISKSYSSKLFIPAQLTDKKLKKSQLKWVLIGNLPLMTKRGHFVLNGAPRVIVNQILRSPGIYFQGSLKEIFSDQWSEKPEITYKRFYTDLICLRGTWLRIEIDKNKDIWAQMKKVPKIPLLWFLLAMGLTERIIFKSVINPTRLLANFNLEIKRKIDYEYVTNASDAWKAISNLISSSSKESGSYTVSTPATTIAEPSPVVTSSDDVFDSDVSSSLATQVGRELDANFVPESGSDSLMVSKPGKGLVFQANSFLSGNKVLEKTNKERDGQSKSELENNETPFLKIKNQKEKVDLLTPLPSNLFLGKQKKGQKNPDLISKKSVLLTGSKDFVSLERIQGLRSKKKGNKAAVFQDNNTPYPKGVNSEGLGFADNLNALRPKEPELLLSGIGTERKLVSFFNIVEHSKEGRNWIFKRFMNPRAYDLGSQGRLNFNRKLGLSISPHQTTLTAQDVLFATDYLFKVEKGLKNIDDIDHLKNRRVRTSGELLQIQIGIGLVRLEKIIREKFSKINAQTRASDFLTSRPNNSKSKALKLDALPLPKKLPRERLRSGKGSSIFSGISPSSPSLRSKEGEEGELLDSDLNENVKNSHSSDLSFPIKEKQDVKGTKKVSTLRSLAIVKKKEKAIPSLLKIGLPLKKKGVVVAFPSPSLATQVVATQGKGGKKRKQEGNPLFFFERGNQSFQGDKRQSKADKNIHGGTNSLGEEFKMNNLINTKAFNGALREFFGSSQLSQFMDQLNPLAEITHKRRLSSMGPGGVTRDSATLAIRGIHPTHYGRICPIETPEGKNTGLVNSLTTYSRASSQGFLESPFYKVYKGQVQKNAGMFFLSAEQEENIKVAAADVATPSGRIGFLPKNKIPAKIAYGDTISKISRNIVEYIGVSPIQMISIATSLIPFVEHDDANRALMGSNMQRQAVPLVRAERPLVGTGLESRTVSDSGHAVIAKESGYVAYVSGKKMVIYTIPIHN